MLCWSGWGGGGDPLTDVVIVPHLFVCNLCQFHQIHPSFVQAVYSGSHKNKNKN